MSPALAISLALLAAAILMWFPSHQLGNSHGGV